MSMMRFRLRHTLCVTSRSLSKSKCLHLAARQAHTRLVQARPAQAVSCNESAQPSCMSMPSDQHC